LARHIGVAIVAGAAFLAVSQAYQPALLEWAASDPARMRARAQLLIAAVGIIVLAPVVGVGLYIWRLGSRTLKEDRFPPEGLMLVRDVLVLRGAEARGRARLLRVLAAAFFVMSGLMALVLYRLATLRPAV
jgi:hypothetical protein